MNTNLLVLFTQNIFRECILAQLSISSHSWLLMCGLLWNLIYSFWKIREVKHSNLQEFYGIAINDENLGEFVLGEVCAKDSLMALLEKTSLVLDWPFKHSIMKGIAAVRFKSNGIFSSISEKNWEKVNYVILAQRSSGAWPICTRQSWNRTATWQPTLS